MPITSQYQRPAAGLTILAAVCFHPAAAAAQATLPHDLSPMGMFEAADIVVKSVMIGLLFASVVTWTIFVAKLVELWLANRRLARAAGIIKNAETLGDAKMTLRQRFGLASHMLNAVHAEAGRSGLHADPAEVKERVSSSLADIVAASGRKMSAGTGMLATIGSTAPFVGLFGTVWGIMNAFIGISQAQTTNLAVVAPGIAEALLATALGLVAAIPAVVVYNLFARLITGYRHQLAALSSEIQRHLSRELGSLPLRKAA